MNIAEIRQKYPQYQDMSDADLASALHKKYYSDMPRDEFNAKVGLTPEAPPQPERSMGDSLKRAAGLTARYAVEGTAALPGVFINPLTQLAGRGKWTDAVSRSLTSAGLPEPSGQGEQVSAEISKALAGGGGLSALAQKGAAAMGTAAPGIVRSMAGAPVADMAYQGVGAGAAEGVRQSGGPEWAALAASVAAPMGAQGVIGATKSAGNAVNEIRRPLTQRGAQQIAADTLGRITQDRSRAIGNIDDYITSGGGVPGSKPTAAATAGDYGLIGGEQLIARGDANPLFAARRGENNAARLADLEKLGATQSNIERLATKRDELTAPLREQAFAKANAPVDLDRARDAINRLRKLPEGNRNETSRALETLDNWIVTRQAEGRVSAQDAYELHKDINLLIQGKVNDDQGVVRLAGGLATQVKNTLANEIDKVAPGFKKYLTTYSRLSKPIERLETISTRLGDSDLSRTTNAMPQIAGNEAYYSLSQDKMRRAVSDLGKGDVKPSARQSDILGRVLGDLNAEAVASRGGKMPGSDTYQNIASANFVNRVLGQSLAESGAGKTLGSVLGKVTPGGLERRINDMIVEAYLDPKKMKELLEMARTSRASPKLSGLLSTGAESGAAGLLGGSLY